MSRITIETKREMSGWYAHRNTSLIGFGTTEELALADLAKKIGIRLWNEETL